MRNYCTYYGMQPPVGMGDAVRLMSGGPDMLVVDVHDDGRTTCAWLGYHGRARERKYFPSALRILAKAEK